MVFRKSRDFWFALISVGPDVAELFRVNSAVFCRLQLALNLSQQCSHPAPPQSIQKVRYNSEKRRVTGCIYLHTRSRLNVGVDRGANLHAPNSLSGRPAMGRNSVAVLRVA